MWSKSFFQERSVKISKFLLIEPFFILLTVFSIHTDAYKDYTSSERRCHIYILHCSQLSVDRAARLHYITDAEIGQALLA